MSKLKVKKVKVNGKELTVTEAVARVADEKDFALSMIFEAYKDKDADALLVSSVKYTQLAACSDGEVPTFDEYLELSESESVKWVNAATNVNPYWFSNGNGEQIEKKRQVALDLSLQMFSIASAKTESKPPETVEITQEEVDRYYPTWSIWRATNRKFLPYSGGFLEQPERLMLALLTMDSVFARMELQVQEQEKKKREDK